MQIKIFLIESWKIDQKFQFNSRIWQIGIWPHFQELTKFLEKFLKWSSVKLYFPNTKSKNRAVKIFNQISDFITGEYKLRRGSIEFLY